MRLSESEDRQVDHQQREESVRAWTASTAGGAVTSWQRLGTGNSRSLWAAEVAGDPESLSLIVRADGGDGPLSGTELTLEREAVVYRALKDSGLPVPRLLGVDPEQGAMVLTRMPGTAEWSDTALDGLLSALGELHALDVERLELPGLARRALDDLELWGRIATERIHPPSPLVDLALEVLRARYPGEPDRLVLCHGDAGPGNVLHCSGRVTALLDWEFAHVGDPVDDLAWVTARAVLFGLKLPDFARRVREHYEPAAGVAVDPARLTYWQAVTLLRNLVSCLAAVSNPVRGRDRLVHLMLIPALERLLVGALADLESVELEPTRPPSGPTTLPGGDVLREVASGLGDLLPTLTDAEAVTRAKRMRLLLTQLAETWTLAPDIARADEDDAVPAPDIATRLQQLADAAERRLALFPRAVPMGRARLAGMTA